MTTMLFASIILIETDFQAAFLTESCHKRILQHFTTLHYIVVLNHTNLPLVVHRILN